MQALASLYLDENSTCHNQISTEHSDNRIAEVNTERHLSYNSQTQLFECHIQRFDIDRFQEPMP
jgi:hypothetical protein